MMTGVGMATKAIDDAIVGVGLEQAAAVAKTTPAQVLRWERLVPPRHRVVRGSGIVRIYGLPELVELRVVTELLHRGVRPTRLRRFVEELRRSGTSNPLRELRWATAGTKLYVGDEHGWFGGISPAQGVMAQTLDLDKIRTSVRRAVSHRPKSAEGRVEHRRGVMGGKAVLAGTRTPVSAVRAYIDRGLPDSEILEAFPHLRPADIKKVRASA